MKKLLSLHLVLACALVFGALLVLPESADASCFGKCERDPYGGLFCRICVSSDTETGVLCQQSGPCGCFYIQCAFSLQSSQERFVTPEDALAEGLFVDTEAKSPVIEETCTPEEILFGLPTDR